MRKRGVVSFLRNRTMRIALPIVVFWLVLWPTMMTQFQAAQIKSGALLTDQTAWQRTVAYFQEMTPATTMTMHMWFIYYLCWIYLMVLFARWVMTWVDRKSAFRNSISMRFGSMMDKPWFPLVMAALCAPLMYPMQAMSGIEMDAMTLYPVWAGLLSYLIYFSLGWLLYRNVDKLTAMLRWWQWQLVGGVVLTICYFFFSHWASQNGYVTRMYPALTVQDVRYDQNTGERCYPELRQLLLESAPESIPGLVFRQLPEARKQYVRRIEDASENQLTGLLQDISTTVISDPGFSTMALGTAAYAESATSIDRDAGAENFELANREILEASFQGLILGEDSQQPFYAMVRSSYCYLYSLTTWLLIIGCIGFSQHFFADESRFWRYFSDSSYWMYLMHLVIQFQLLLWVGDLPWHWSLKFGFYVLVTLGVLCVTYHFLVRPTWIGWLLNGRMYPISRRSVEGTQPSHSPIPTPHFSRTSTQHKVRQGEDDRRVAG
ncbi:MAG: acyltransferase [bacterium]|nr:acyltransferase [bacterium]